nr:unnamed protein product [Callosobruchus chinensis]
MDLRSTLMLLKVEAFLGANPLMKLNGTKLTLSKITYAVQAFYGLFLIINTVMVIFNIVNRMFAPNGSNIPQFWQVFG